MGPRATGKQTRISKQDGLTSTGVWPPYLPPPTRVGLNLLHSPETTQQLVALIKPARHTHTHAHARSNEFIARRAATLEGIDWKTPIAEKSYSGLPQNTPAV